MRKLALAMEHAVRGVAKDCSHESFEKSFPQLARDNPKALAEARDAADVFQQLVAQRGVDVKLDELDALTEAVAHMPKQEVDRE
nr:hypothetical protein HK105_005934 [Polyrhizophydium stewartii]